jgi:hypothetical protein
VKWIATNRTWQLNDLADLESAVRRRNSPLATTRESSTIACAGIRSRYALPELVSTAIGLCGLRIGPPNDEKIACDRENRVCFQNDFKFAELEPELRRHKAPILLGHDGC